MASSGWKCLSALALVLCCSTALQASTIYVAAGGDLQAALNAAQPGDTVLLAAGSEFVGNYYLPVKSGAGWIIVRSDSPDTILPGPGIRIRPSHAPLLARLRSPNGAAALRTAAGAHHWDLRYLEFGANLTGIGDLMQIGDGSSVQNSLDKVPHHIVLNHLYIHGDPRYGQKRCISLNAAHVTISDSHVAECKGIGQDTQAIGGWNGPGPYLIENNYLEAAGENVMFGGADPAIANLVADGITFRRNYLSRPMSWRQPIIATPAAVQAAAQGGGSLAAGAYAYRIVARGTVGQGNTGRSTASAEVTATVASSGGAVRLQWQPVQWASEYRVYGRTPGAQNTYWTVTTTAFVDTGAAGTAEAVPTTAGTVWTVKNLFELKNARNVVVSDNILENHWKEAQPGYAIVLTPRNSNGACTWCVVEHVRFENNLVRNVAAGINLLGYDLPTRPTRQTNDIVVRNNLFTGLATSLGGNAWFLLMGDEPRDVVIEHNTVDSNGSTVLNVYGGTSTDPREVLGFQMTANAARHATYGINGSFFTYGNGILNGYFPDGVFTANYLAGGSSSRYPAGNFFAGLLQDQYVSVPSDFTVRAGSILKGAAPDGSAIGVDFATLSDHLTGVDTGVSTVDLVPPTADFTIGCTYLSCAFANASAAGTGAIVSTTWSFGDGTGSTEAAGTHAYTAAGTYTVTLTVVDANNLSSSASRTVTVEPPNTPPTAAFQVACLELSCTFTNTSTDGDGQVVSSAWAAGAASSSQQSWSFTFAAPGTYAVTLTVTDNDGAASTTTKNVTVTSLLHAALVNGFTARWNSKNSKTFYWSADVTIGVHGSDERPIPGATVKVSWSGAVTKTATCVTNTSGRCTFKSGTLSMLRSWVTLTILEVTAPGMTYSVGANHGLPGSGGKSVTYNRP